MLNKDVFGIIAEYASEYELLDWIDFEKKLKENGGVLKTHSGKFMHTMRRKGVYMNRIGNATIWRCCGMNTKKEGDNNHHFFFNNKKNKNDL
jgi:hypothetical protein